MLRYLIVIMLMLAAPSMARELTVILPAEDGHSINARILMRYWQKHDTEISSVSYKLMPGASSIVATNYLYNVAPRDGWTIGVTFKKTPLIGAVGGANINFDPSKFTWLGSAADGRNDAVLLIANRKLDPDKPLVIGFDSPISTEPMQFVAAALGNNVKQVTGYKGTPDIRVAFEKGEIDAFINSMIGIKTQAPHLLASDHSVILMQFGNGQHRHPEFPTVPTLAGSITSPGLLALLRLSELQYILIRPFLAPPGIPVDRVAALRTGFEAAVRDPGYVADAKAAGIDVNLVTWQETDRIINEMVAAPRALLDQLQIK
jgi:tripartite-type tricarboxylate transporter receptor subunit TctC